MSDATAQTSSSAGTGARQVVVSFTAPDRWGFTPSSVTLDGPGSVVLVRDSGSASWTFVTAAVKYPDNDQFKVTVPNGADRCIIRDDWRVRGTYEYLVVVSDGGQTYVSPDPQIIHSGP